MSRYLPTSDLTPSLAQDVLMTILPVHADLLYRGDKVFELRKTIPRTIPRRIFLYETGPAAAVTGHVIVDAVITGSPDYVWNQTRELGTTKPRFDRYFFGRSVAYAYKVSASVQYSKPISRLKLLELDSGFRVPQHFLYVQNLPRIAKHLDNVALEESFANVSGDIRLAPLPLSGRKAFKRLVARHIDHSYLETGATYADVILRIAEGGDDPEGFLTLRKVVQQVLCKNRPVGYVVFTLKHGGSVKTGPVILDREQRDRGLGKALRSVIHSVFLRFGYRKVFATVPTSNARACQYLLSSGYRIEAQLARQYHTDHDELVLGYMLSHSRGSAPEFIRQIEPAMHFSQIEKVEPRVVAFLKEEFSGAYCAVTEEWAERQITLACGGGSTFKPRLAFLAEGVGLLAVAICLLKRGGSAKVIVLTRTAHQPSLTSFIEFVARGIEASQADARRIYTMVPLYDSDVVQSFIEFGCSPEGVLTTPYNENSDVIVLARLLNRASPQVMVHKCPEKA